MLLETHTERAGRIKTATVRFTEEEYNRLNDFICEANAVVRKFDKHARPLSQNEFCRRAIFAAIGEQTQ
jgi:hypothetical protein